MRKKLFVCLMLMMCILAQVVPVGAAGFDINSVPDPSAGMTLVSANDIVVKDGVTLTAGNEGDTREMTYTGDFDCKIISYSVSRDLFLVGEYETKTYTDDLTGVSHDVESLVLSEVSTYNEAISRAVVLTKGDSFVTLLSRDVYVVFVDVGTNTARCKCNTAELSNYYLDLSKVTPATSKAVKVTMVSGKEKDGVVTNAVFQVDYFMPGIAEDGSTVVERATCVYTEPMTKEVKITDGSVSGSLNFSVDSLSSGTYKFYVKSDQGAFYSDVLVVGSGEAGGSFEMYTGTYDAPIITISGMPQDGSLVDAPLELILESNIPADIVFDGNLVASQTVHTTVIVGENRVYPYSAVSAVGQVTEGSVNVSCLKSGTSISGMDLEESVGLVQTGQDGASIGLVVCIGLVIVLAGVCILLYSKRNGGFSK